MNVLLCVYVDELDQLDRTGVWVPFIGAHKLLQS